MKNFNKQRIRKSVAKKSLAKPKGKFEELERTASQPDWMTRVFRNNHYTVMIDDNAILSNGQRAIKAMIQRHDDRPFTRHWREMQSIKNEIFGADKVGIEFYPPESELIDDYNIYWLWIIDEQPRYIPKQRREKKPA